MANGGVAQYLSLSLIALPSLFFALRFLAAFPIPPVPVAVYPSLADLPRTIAERAWQIYPEELYEGGAYVSLPCGRVRYWLIGPEKGQKVVLIHGLSVPSIIWKDMAPQLAASGFRVLIYDLYGRGYSDAPSMAYNAGLYTTQLALLMQYVRWDRAHVVGFSMGGGIAASFAATFPHLTTGKFALIASAGLIEASDLSRTSKIMSSPLVQYVTSTSPFRYLLRRLSTNDNTSMSDPLREIVQIQSAHLPGFNFAVASSLRDGPIRGTASAFEAMNAPGADLLLIWGTDDRTVSYKYAARIQKTVPKSTLITIDDGKHDLPWSHSDTVAHSLISFFKSSKSK